MKNVLIQDILKAKIEAKTELFTSIEDYLAHTDPTLHELKSFIVDETAKEINELKSLLKKSEDKII